MLGRAVWSLLCVGTVVGTLTCPDGSRCEEDNTCCRTKDGYECCLYPNAMCCKDQLHCCPVGFRCSPATQECVHKGLPWYRTSWAGKSPAKLSLSGTRVLTPSTPEQSEVKSVEELQLDVSVVHCDNYYTCPDFTTCCRNPYGQWACCPYQSAHCCRDGFHCCPAGTHCDSTSTHCLKDDLETPALPKMAASRVMEVPALPKMAASRVMETPALPKMATSGVLDAPWPVPVKEEQEGGDISSRSKALTGVIRCDGRYYCPDGYSCCKTPAGEWGCCPHALGVCCADGKHCCEWNWKCDATSLNCVKGDSKITSSTLKETLLL